MNEVELDLFSATLLFVLALIFVGGIVAALELRRDAKNRTRYVWECDKCGFDTWGVSEADVFYWYKIHQEECGQRRNNARCSHD